MAKVVRDGINLVIGGLNERHYSSGDWKNAIEAILKVESRNVVIRFPHGVEISYESESHVLAEFEEGDVTSVPREALEDALPIREGLRKLLEPGVEAVTVKVHNPEGSAVCLFKLEDGVGVGAGLIQAKT